MNFVSANEAQLNETFRVSEDGNSQDLYEKLKAFYKTAIRGIRMKGNSRLLPDLDDLREIRVV